MKQYRTYKVLHILFAKFLLWLCRVEVKGVENIPKDGGYLICPNHIGNFDSFIIGAALPRRIHFLCKAEAFYIPFSHFFLKLFGAIPLHRGSCDVKAMKTAINYLKNGICIGIYPQGHRRPKVHPNSTPILEGIGMLSYRAQAPIIPVAFAMKGMKYGPFKKKVLIFGEPYLYPFQDQNLKEQYERATKSYFEKTLSLIDFNEYLEEKSK